MDSHTARALYRFSGHDEYNELSFEAGDAITILKSDVAEGWLLGEKDGCKGLVPASYVQVTVWVGCICICREHQHQPYPHRLPL
jgi:sorting nexin-9/18/33